MGLQKVRHDLVTEQQQQQQQQQQPFVGDTQGSAQESLGRFRVLSKMLFCLHLHEFTQCGSLETHTLGFC